MAADDIYSIQANYEAPTGSASFKLYYQQTIDATQVNLSTQVFAEAWITQFGNVWRAILSVEWGFVGIKCEKKDGLPHAAFLIDNSLQAGTFLSSALPGNNAIQFSIKQATLNARHDGRIYVPGIPESETTTGALDASFFDPNVEAVRALLDSEIVEESAGAGRWSLGVINQAILNAPMPPLPKDWAAAFAVATGVTAHTIIATMRKRQTKIGHRAIA